MAAAEGSRQRPISPSQKMNRTKIKQPSLTSLFNPSGRTDQPVSSTLSIDTQALTRSRIDRKMPLTRSGTARYSLPAATHGLQLRERTLLVLEPQKPSDCLNKALGSDKKGSQLRA